MRVQPHPRLRATTPRRYARARCPELAEAVGALLRMWRWQAAMSLEQVAIRMKSHRPIVGRLESGHHVPSLDSIMRHARATGGDPRQALALVDAWYGRVAPEGAD